MELNYEIVEPIGILSKRGVRTKEINLVNWNGAGAKYDLRLWQTDGTGKIARKGITLDEDEVRTLLELLKRRFDGREDRAQPAD